MLGHSQPAPQRCEVDTLDPEILHQSLELRDELVRAFSGGEAKGDGGLTFLGDNDDRVGASGELPAARRPIEHAPMRKSQLGSVVADARLRQRFARGFRRGPRSVFDRFDEGRRAPRGR
jgi:hypothetical protein